MDLVALDLETTGFDTGADRIVEIGAVRLTLAPDGTVVLGAQLSTLVDPGRLLPTAVARLTGLTDEDLSGAPPLADALVALAAFIGEATVVGHNVGFDLAFLERAGFAPPDWLDTSELASILLPTAPSYALQQLALGARLEVTTAHRALADALTSVAVLADLFRLARSLPPDVLEEVTAASVALGEPTRAFFAAALRGAFTEAAAPAALPRSAIASLGGPSTPAASRPSASAERVDTPPSTRPAPDRRDRGQRGGVSREEGRFARERPDGGDDANVDGPTERDGPRPRQRAAALPAEVVLGPDGPLAAAIPGFEDRPEQRELATAIERIFETGGVLVAEAGTGVGKSLAYSVPALARAAAGERVIVSTHTLPLQDQLVRKDLPALQEALGSSEPVAVLKGRGNYLCPRRWQQFRSTAETREEVRLALKVLLWRQATSAGDRAELHFLGGESSLWPRISADDESCTARRCAATRGGCYLERARSAAATARLVVVNHALLLHDARASNTLLPEAEHVVVDEAHRLEDAAVDAFGHRLEPDRLRRDLDRIGRSPLVLSALRGEAHLVQAAEAQRAEVARGHEVAAETFDALAELLPGRGPYPAQGPLPLGAEDRLRITTGVRVADERWLSVEVAAERLSDALAGVRIAGERLRALGGDEDEIVEHESATKELIGAQSAITHGIHQPRAAEVVWLERSNETSAVGLYVAPAHIGAALRRTLVDRHRSVVLTSATLAVAGAMGFALERFGVADIADTLRVGSPFDHASQAVLLVPTDIVLPHEAEHAEQVAEAIDDVARAIEGRTLALFTSHAALREVAGHLAPLEDAGIAVLVQGVDGSRRALLERFAAGGAVLLGTRSFWEGVDLPGDLLRCVVVARLPFDVPDDPLVEGRAERYDDPFREYQLPQAALRLRQGVGRLIRTRSDRGAIVILDRRLITRDYGPTLIASLPPTRLQRVPRASLAALVAEHCARG